MGVGKIFFFKQKTAYEIKECDWSSDVCSSDLGKQKLVDSARRVEKFVERTAKKAKESAVRKGKKEIGRASCRERV